MPTADRPPPEELARQTIDAKLTEAGWVVQDRDELNLAAGPGVAVREFQTDAGPCDYLLFVDQTPAGIIEAKKDGVALTGVEAQTRDYAGKLPSWLNPPLRPLPFLYEATSKESHFTNLLDPTPRSRRVFSFHQPRTLAGWLQQAVAIEKGRPGAPVAPTFVGRMQQAPPLITKGMWPPQITAVENLEASIRDGRRRALVQMATGSGKTYMVIAALYRMIKFGAARRALFLVDRGNLGDQAVKEFQRYETPDDGRTFTELYNANRLTSNRIDPIDRVVVTTIQRLYSMLKGEPQYDDDLEQGSAFEGSGSALVREPPPVVYSPFIPPEFFDVVVVDECHRSIYTLDRDVCLAGHLSGPGAEAHVGLVRIGALHDELGGRSAVGRPVHLVLQAGEEGAGGLHPGVVVDARSVDIEHLAPEHLLRGADVSDSSQELVEVAGRARTRRVLEAPVVHGEALDDILLQVLGGPLAKQGSSGGPNAVADRQDHRQGVVLEVATDLARALPANL